MIVVIQCAAKKQANSGFLRTSDGRPILFVAKPDVAPHSDDFGYACPDDISDDGQSWRQVLVRYNEAPGSNPLQLSRAYELYANPTYRRLTDRFGRSNTYILSAGWGLISASFLTPAYDITFSATAEPFKRRKKGDTYRDFQMIQNDCEDEIVFFGGKDYLPLFCSLTSRLRCPRTVFYNSSSPPTASGCSLSRYVTTTRTNWHYECANQFLDGSLKGDDGSEADTADSVE